MIDNTPRTSGLNLPFPCAADLVEAVNSLLDRDNPALGHVYLIESTCGTRVKIGRSTQPSNRISNIVSTSGGIRQYFVSEQVCDAVSIETTLHRAFLDYRVKGEWFAVDFQKALLIVKSVCERFLATQGDIAQEKANQEASGEKVLSFFKQILQTPTFTNLPHMDAVEEREARACTNPAGIHPLVIRDQRVLTLAQIDTAHGRPAGTAKRNFTENRSRLVEGEDYFRVSPDEIRTTSPGAISDAIQSILIVVTESGYLLLVKSFTDDLAWQVQKRLVASYFRAKESAQPIASPIAAGMRWLAHIDRAGQMVFNPINPEDFCLPAHAWPKVIASPDFPRELLPEVVAAVGERMKGLAAPAVTAVDPHRVAAFVAGLQQVTGHEICAGLGIADNRSHQTMVGYVMGRLGWSKRKLMKAWVYIR